MFVRKSHYRISVEVDRHRLCAERPGEVTGWALGPQVSYFGSKTFVFFKNYVQHPGPLFYDSHASSGVPYSTR
jgi:hypothetical protein